MRLLAVGLLLITAAEAGAQARQLSLREVARYGSVDGDAALTSISDLLLDDHGTLFVAQPQEQLIRSFSKDGRVRTWGRRGRGPGEYTQPQRLGWYRDSLVVQDRALQRLTLLSLSGTAGRTIGGASLTVPSPWSPTAPAGLLSDGSVVMVPAFRGGARGTPPRTLPILRFGRGANTAATTLATLQRGASTLEVKIGNANAVLPHPMPSAPRWDLHPRGDGLAVLQQEAPTTSARHTFVVRRVRSDGSTMFTKEFAFTPSAIRRQTADSIVNDVADQLYRRMSSVTQVDRQQLRDQVRSALALPEFWPGAKRLLMGWDGSIWIERYGPTTGMQTWDVLEADGSFHGQLRVPASITLHHVSLTDVVAASKFTDYDIPIAIRYQLR